MVIEVTYAHFHKQNLSVIIQRIGYKGILDFGLGIGYWAWGIGGQEDREMGEELIILNS